MIHYGTINSYDPFKGFGFIRRLEGKDVFFHYTSLKIKEEHIAEGVKVSFSVEKTEKGLKAVDVKKVC